MSDHHALLTRLLVAARLLAPDAIIPHAAASAALARACGQADMAALLHSLARARKGIAQCWADQFGKTLEIET